MHAVIRTGGKQYLIKEGDAITVEKLPGDVGAEVQFAEVLMTASDDENEVIMGSPRISGTLVAARILEQGRAKKVTVIKYKPKVRYRRKRGHRQFFTKLQILSIS